MSVGIISAIFFFALLASFIQRVSGFGFGILIMTVLPFIMPSYAEATALSGMLALVNALVTAVRQYRYLSWKKLLPILITFIIISFFSVRMVAGASDHSLKRVLGAFLILVSIYFFFLSERIRLRPTLPMQLGMGGLSGVMGGFFAMQGPPAVIYFIASTDDKNEYIALTQWYFLVGNFSMTLFRAGNNFVTGTVLKSWLIGLPAVFIGLYLGGKVFDRIPVKILRKVIYAYMAVAGLLVLLV